MISARTLPVLLALGASTPAFAWYADPPRPPPGTVVVENDSGGAVDVEVAGLVRHLRPGDRTAFTAPAGDQNVRATYVQFGQERLADFETVGVYSYHTSFVTIDREESARILIKNDTRQRATLTLSGTRRAYQLDPGESKVVRVRAGLVDLTLTADDGRVLERTRLDAEPFAEPTWTVCLPRTADVFVSNPLPIAVDVSWGPGGRVEIPAYGRTVLDDLPAGGVTLVAERTTGQRVDTASITLRGGVDASWTIDPPTTGLLVVDSDHYRASTVLVDGRNAAMLGPDQEQTLELPLGRHHVTVIDDRGLFVEQADVTIDPYRTARMEAEAGRGHDDRYSGRDDDHDGWDRDHDDHDEGRGEGHAYGHDDDHGRPAGRSDDVADRDGDDGDHRPTR